MIDKQIIIIQKKESKKSKFEYLYILFQNKTRSIFFLQVNSNIAEESFNCLKKFFVLSI